MTLTAAPCAALFCSLLLLVQGCGPLGVHASTLPDLLFRSAGRVSSVEPIDLAGNAAAVEAVARARSYRGELIVLAATASHWPYAINAVSELALLGMEHYVFIAPSRTDCDVLRARRPGLACVFSTLVSNTTMAQEKSFTVWTTRKRYVGRWAALGLGVLQADLDVIWYANPYPALKGALRNVSLVHLQEGKCNEGRANGGMLYAQSACDGSTAHWVLREVYERVRRNEDDPRILETHYPGLFSDEPVKAPAPFPEQKYREIVRRCSDEQDTLRDALLSAFTGQDLHYYNVRSYAWQHTGKEQWFERFAAAKGEDFHCDRVEFGAESLPGVCYVPSKPGKAPRALVRELTPHTRARINRDASEAEVFCDGERPLELGGFAPYELFGGVGLAMNQHTRDRDCSQLSVTTVPGQLWARAPVSPTSIVHLVGVSHPGRGVMQRVAGAWEASIDPQLTEADHVPPARRRGRALALAWPLDVQRFESLDEFEELLQSLLMAADATERVMAVPATLCKLAHTNSRGKWWTGWNSFYQLPIGPGQAATSTALAQPPHVEAPIDRACIWLMQKQEYCKEWEMLHPPDLDKMVAAQGGPTSVKKVPLEQLLATVEGGGSSWEALTWSPHASAPQLPDADFAFDAAKLDALVGGEEAVVVIDIGERHKLPWGVTNIAPGSAVDARIKDRDVRKCIIVKDHQPTGRFSASADRAAEAATRTETHDAAGTHLSKPPSPSPPPSLPSLPLEKDGSAALADVVEEQPVASSGVEQAVRTAATACAQDNAVALVSCDASKKSDIDDTSQPGPCLRQRQGQRQGPPQCPPAEAPVTDQAPSCSLAGGAAEHGCGCVLLVPPCELVPAAHSMGDAVTVQAAVAAVHRGCDGQVVLDVAYFGGSFALHGLAGVTAAIPYANALAHAHVYSDVVVLGTDVLDGRYGVRNACWAAALAARRVQHARPVSLVSISYDGEQEYAAAIVGQLLPVRALYRARNAASVASLQMLGATAVEQTFDIAYLAPSYVPQGAAAERSIAWVRERKDAGDLVLAANLFVYEVAQERVAGQWVAHAATELMAACAALPTGRRVSVMLVAHDWRRDRMVKLGIESEVEMLKEVQRAIQASSGGEGDCASVHLFAGGEQQLPSAERAVLDQVDVVFSGYMHLMIIAASTGAPILGIGTQPKFRRLISDVFHSSSIDTDRYGAAGIAYVVKHEEAHNPCAFVLLQAPPY